MFRRRIRFLHTLYCYFDVYLRAVNDKIRREKSRFAIIIIIRGVCAVGTEDVRPTPEVASYRITRILAHALYVLRLCNLYIVCNMYLPYTSAAVRREQSVYASLSACQIFRARSRARKKFATTAVHAMID